MNLACVNMGRKLNHLQFTYSIPHSDDLVQHGGGRHAVKGPRTLYSIARHVDGNRAIFHCVPRDAGELKCCVCDFSIKVEIAEPR